MGEKFGRLTIIEKIIVNKSTRYKCKCDCGNVKTIRSSDLKSGKTKSCGCLNLEAKKHGMSRTDVYRIWQTMKTRCESGTYLKKSITVCQRWLDSFKNFYEDMGDRPSKEYSIDRKNNNGNYEPGNCRWATAKEQARNRSTNVSYTYNGETKCLAGWEEKFNLPNNILSNRIKAGMDFKKAISTPVEKHSKLHTYKGKTQNIKNWAKDLKIKPWRMYDLLAKGLSIEEVLNNNKK